MHISTKFDFCKIPNHRGFNVRLMVNIESEPKSGKISKPLNLALVLDRSGSMGGHKLRYVKEASKILVNNMGNDDIFSLTVFDSGVKPLIPPVKVDQAYGFEETINSIASGDTTNLSGGYQQGCAFAKEKMMNENISRVMLLTDGLANRGIVDPDHLADIAKTMQVEGISTTTIGVGEDYNEFLLGKMAENGGGGTYFIENPDDAPSVFEEELGYLKSLAASDFELKVVPADENIRFDQLNTYRTLGRNLYLLGDVYEGQVKSIVFELNPPKMEIGQDIEIGHIEVSYRDASEKEEGIKSLKIPLKIDVVSEKDFSKITPDKDVVTASAHLTVARGKREAIKLADRRKYEEAADLLEEYADAIEKLIHKYKLDSPRLITDINELRERAQNLRSHGEEYYSRTERKRMYYESDMLMKSKLASYDAMVDRRRGRGRRQRPQISKFPCFFVNGHIWAEIGNDRVLIDSGAPLSIGHNPSFNLGSQRFPLQKDFMGFDVDDFSRLTGMRISVVLGADILNAFDYVIDLKNEELLISTDSIDFRGNILKSDYFQGVPIISAKIDKRNVKLFFDTGAKLSYIKSSIAPDYPVVGQDTDFYPGFGEFQVETHKVPLLVAGHSLHQEMGILPQTLEMTLMATGIDGILGTTIFDRFKVCFSARRKQIIINEV